MKILFLTNLLPCPLDNGGKIKTYNTLKALYNAGNSIDVVCFNEKENVQKAHDKAMREVCSNYYTISAKLTTADNVSYMVGKAFISLFSTLPYSVFKYNNMAMRRLLFKLAQTKAYDCIYFDHVQLEVYGKIARKLWPKARCVLDEHNCETTIMERSAQNTSTVAKNIFLRIEAKKIRRFERKAIQSADRTIVLSDADYKALMEIVGHDFKHSIIPICVNDNGLKENISSKSFNILFLGTLTWEPNRQGIIWFVENVLPIISDFDYKLYIVGKSTDNRLDDLARNNSKIELTGYVESVDYYYDICDCMVVPLFIGSGQRVKIIEAFSKGMPVISTTIGAEGLECQNGKELLFANSDYSFASCIKNVTRNDVRSNLAKNGRSCYEKHYSIECVNKQIVDAVAKCFAECM